MAWRGKKQKERKVVFCFVFKREGQECPKKGEDESKPRVGNGREKCAESFIEFRKEGVFEKKGGEDYHSFMQPESVVGH